MNENFRNRQKVNEFLRILNSRSHKLFRPNDIGNSHQRNLRRYIDTKQLTMTGMRSILQTFSLLIEKRKKF